MKCLEPGMVKPEDLIAYIAGEANSRTAAHITACSACAAQAAAYAETDRVLQSRLFRIDCPETLTLGELALEVLPPEEALAVRSHLVHCPHCRAELTELVNTLQGDPLADLSAGRGWLGRIVARLIPAPTLQPAFAVRGGGSSAGLTYEAAELTISLTVERDREAERWNLLGAVLDETNGDVPPGVEVRLLVLEQAIAQTATDEWGLFTFSALETGQYNLELELPDRIVAVESIDIGDTSSRTIG